MTFTLMALSLLVFSICNFFFFQIGCINLALVVTEVEIEVVVVVVVEVVVVVVFVVKAVVI